MDLFEEILALGYLLEKKFVQSRLIIYVFFVDMK
ncbi:hypothetical protein M2105_001277 [Paenibacillus sp. PastF-1]|nr:hypothetical protein [Paenibacillus sp. PastF-2]MDF9846860.1 hypothetical protein [Paenibacillus sp. PastM-2]MDF9853432.1 hypothetical protein [Paenibacillus sp. PastF-1]MDH6479081.1 hypothetical protein [Paenibacillus sp. PastH-2]